MLQRLKVPNTLQWVIRLFLLYLLVFTLFRLGTYLNFNPDHHLEHGEGEKRYGFIKILPSFLF